jgi:cytidyltransferase-like protein
MNKSFGAKVISLKDFPTERGQLGDKKIIAASGGFDPVHPGHISYLIESKKLGDVLVVIVNGDAFLTTKKGKPFQNLQQRCSIVSALPGVDYVIPFEIDNDMTVGKALEIVRPHAFANGGDRSDKHTVPEWAICKKHNIEFVTGVGLEKKWSSSDLLSKWTKSDLVDET